MHCFMCGGRPAERGAACWRCLEPALADERAAHSEIVSAYLDQPRAWLLDARGVLHPIGGRTELGRRSVDVAILNPRVSRRHAHLFQRGSLWYLEDLGSRHGTRLRSNALNQPQDSVDWSDPLAPGEPLPLRSGDCLALGPVRLLFSLGDPEPEHLAAPGRTTVSSVSLIRPVLSGAENGDGAPVNGGLHPWELHSPEGRNLNQGTPKGLGELRLLDPIPGGFGSLSFRDQQLSLSPLQCKLVELFMERNQVDRGIDPAVRGYVSSTELLVTLPWETPYPQGETLKQLIRRTRTKLRGCGLSIESKRGLGYRLQLQQV